MLAERARISVEAVSTLERGTRRAPQRETLARLAEALELNAAQRAVLERAAARFVRDPKSSAGASPASTPNALPVPLTSFVGREAELAEVAMLLRTKRLVTLVGAGGIGKTRTALQIGNALRDGWTDGVWFVELAPLADGGIIPATIAATLGIDLPGTREPLTALAAALTRRRSLLIIDNCEHLVEHCARTVDAILRACPHIVILATSRQSLGIGGEVTYRLPSLGVPPEAEIDDLSAREAQRYGAVALFVERGTSVDRRFALTDACAPFVAKIALRLDGIPLALELAAARLNVLAVRELFEKLDERFRILTAGARTALPRQRTMRALIDWSYDLLSLEERAVFRSLSVFAGGFTLELATAVVGLGDVRAPEEVRAAEVFDLVSSLVDKSLVEAESSVDDTRYRLLESMREYGRAKLTEHAEHAAVAQAHALAYLEFAQQLDSTWIDTPDHEWIAQVEPELENWRAALEWALVTRADVLVGARLVAALRWVWFYLAAPEGRRWAVAALRAIDATRFPGVAARLELTEAHLAVVLAQRKAGLAAVERAQALFEQLDGFNDPIALAEIQRITGRAHTFLGRFAEAEALLTEALTTFRAQGAGKLAGMALEALAGLRFAAGDVAAARPLYAEASTIFKAVGADRSLTNVATNRAEAEFRAGDAATALVHANEALAAARARNDTRSIALSLTNIAAYLVALQRWDEAREHAREALTKARQANDPIYVAFALQHLAAAAALRTNSEAEDDFEMRTNAAQLLGYADARLAALEAAREYTEQREYDAVLRALRDAFGTSRIEELMRAGSTWTEDQAVWQATGDP